MWHDEISPKIIRAKGGPVSSVRVPENFPDVEDVVLPMGLDGDAKVLQVLLPAKDMGTSCIPPLVCLSLGPAKSGESSEIESVSLLCQHI